MVEVQRLAWAVVALLAGCAAASAGDPPPYLSLDDDVPGLEPRVFAGDVIAPNREHVGYGAFDPQTGDFYYAVTNAQWFPNRLWVVRAGTRAPEPLRLHNEQWEGEPAFASDGRMYFTAVEPPGEGPWHADLFRVARVESGWGQPEKLGGLVNTKASEWKATFAADGTMYFVSERKAGTSALHGDIYRATMRDGEVVAVEELPASVNTEHNDSDPLIAPDEGFLVFHSDRPGGVGQHDLYVSFREGDGWSPPVNLGEPINTPGWEMAPVLTPDGKYLMFTWRAAMQTEQPGEIRWVSIEAIERLRGR